MFTDATKYTVIYNDAAYEVTARYTKKGSD